MSKKLSEGLGEQDPRFEDLLGKKVECSTEDGQKHYGELTFAGVNPLHGKFQCTLSRKPVWPVNPETVKLYINPQTDVN